MAGHVYLIGSRIFNWYKIGKSGNAAIRVTDLGILLPFRIEVLAVWKAANHHEMESLLHEKYASHRVNGEWFTFSVTEIETIIKGMAAIQIEVATGFSNIEKDSKPNIRHASLTPFGGDSKKASKRIDALVRMNRELQRENQELRAKNAPPAKSLAVNTYGPV